MYSNILVPVSFELDRNAEQAIKIAQRLRMKGGKITVLHVVEHLPQYASSLLPEDHVDQAVQLVTDKLSPLIDRVENAEIVVIEGHSARTIVDYAQEHGKDCIAIASHRPGMQDLFLGSTAARVVRHAQCAVHVLR
jgi:nucleotide-binding universal stress UspA family protein